MPPCSRCAPSGGTRWNIVGMFIKEEVTMTQQTLKPTALEENLELANLDLEEALEQQVQDYFSDWPVDDLEEGEGRIVLG